MLTLKKYANMWAWCQYIGIFQIGIKLVGNSISYLKKLLKAANPLANILAGGFFISNKVDMIMKLFLCHILAKYTSIKCISKTGMVIANRMKIVCEK